MNARMARWLTWLLLVSAALIAEQSSSPLVAIAKVALPGVHGALNHLAADYYQGRLFIAAGGNDTVEVIDVHSNSVLTSIHEVSDPQGIAFVKSANRVFVTNAGDGSLRMFDGSTLKPFGSLHLGQNPGAIRVDPFHDRLYIGYGDGAIAVVDSTGKHLSDITLKSHPESFQIAETQRRLFVNLPDSHAIDVVDLSTSQVIAEWPIQEGQENFPMAIDEDSRRVFVASRRPSRLLVLDMDSGRVVAHLPTVGNADDLCFDSIHARIYVAGGRGQMAVYSQQSPDRYTQLDSVATVAGARTALFVPQWNRLFVAVRDFSSHAAEIRIYQPE